MNQKDDENSERFRRNQCIGITRGGRNTKIHAVVGVLDNPIHVQLSPGNIHDATIAEEVLDHVDLNETTVMADRAYGTYDLREYIANRDTDFCIPPKSNAVDPYYCDWSKYKERHLVECFFNKLKENRRIAIRFDKLQIPAKRNARVFRSTETAVPFFRNLQISLHLGSSYAGGSK